MEISDPGYGRWIDRSRLDNGRVAQFSCATRVAVVMTCSGFHTLQGHYPIEGVSRQQRRMPSVGRRLSQAQLLDRLTHIPRHERARRLHCGDPALGFLEAIQTSLAEAFLLGQGT